MRRRDELAIHNERMKLIASFFNAMAIGLIGFALLRPLVEAVAPVTLATVWWSVVAFAFHLAAHYVLGKLEKEVTP